VEKKKKIAVCSTVERLSRKKAGIYATVFTTESSRKEKYQQTKKDEKKLAEGNLAREGGMSKVPIAVRTRS